MPILNIKTSNKNENRPRLRKFIIVVVFILLLLILVGIFINNRFKTKSESKVDDNSKIEKSLAVQENRNKAVDTSNLKLKTISTEEFLRLYEESSYPNTNKLIDAPPITGDIETDQHIQKLAESRGFKLRSVPIEPITKLGLTALAEPFLLQDKARTGWENIKAEALKVGLNLSVTSGFRSIDDQRNIFLDRMKNVGVNIPKIKDGSQDVQLLTALKLVAAPGYSRHHTGYTVDFSCQGEGSFTFVASKCYTWIIKDNFSVAKKFGWIPSYPPGIEIQGPDPEPWEFVWIGSSSLYEQ